MKIIKFNDERFFHILRFIVAILCTIGFAVSCILYKHGITLPLDIIMAIFVIACVCVFIMLLWHFTRGDDY